MRIALHYFRWAAIVTASGLLLAFWLGWRYEGGLAGALSFLLICGVLAVLEISLSFDNAIVNANKLRTMAPAWQRRFLTWGILIAVFGMRIVFPLLVVVVAAGIGPLAALKLAASEPQEYARLISESHVSIAAFGGTFLMLVALGFFMDPEKSVDWLGGVEVGLRQLGRLKAVAYAITVAVVAGFGWILPGDERLAFFEAAGLGLVVFLAVDTLSRVLDTKGSGGDLAQAGGFGAFLYLEVLDASFSFDGVIGAFALTQNMFLIAIGLGIGAMYVRSMTIMLVERQTLAEFRYLEHGAFWSILSLSGVMFVQALVPVPEAITGLIGAGFIGLSLMASLRFNRRVRESVQSGGCSRSR